MKPVHENQSGHEEFVSALCRLIGARSYLELGVYHGDTLKRVAFDSPHIRCVGVEADGSKLRPPFPSNVSISLGTTDYYFQSARIGEFDLVFIDASHRAEDVWKDLVNAYGVCTEHGLILLHDTYPKDEASTDEGLCGTAHEVADSISKYSGLGKEWAAKLEAVTLPYHPGLTIIRKRRHHLPWGNE